MLVEFLAHLVEFDFIWIVGLIMGNLHWLFAFAAAAYIFFDCKRLVMPFILVVGICWTAGDFSAASGWTWTVPVFLGIFYISRIAVLTFCVEIKSLKNILPVVNIVHFFTVYIIFNLFIV